MHRTPNRVYLFGTVTALLVLVFSLSPGSKTLAAVSLDFDTGFSSGAPIDPVAIPGVSFVSSPPNSTITQGVIPPANSPPFSGLSLLNQAAGSAGTLTIDFTQLQQSYSFDYLINNLLGPTTNDFVVQGIRSGVPGTVFVDTLQSTVSPDQAVASHTGAVFDRLVISSTAAEWAIDNINTADAPPGVSFIGSPTVDETGPTSDSYVIALDTAPGAGNVRINLTTDGQCTVNPTFVSFAMGTSVPQPVNVTAVDDDVMEVPSPDCVISHSFDGSTNDPTYLGLGSLPSKSVPVTDNDVASVDISPLAVAISEGAGTQNYSVVLGSQPTNPVSIQITNPDAQCTLNGDTIPVTLTFNDTNWNVAQTVAVGAVDDLLVEGMHTCTIVHAMQATLDANYSVLPSLSPAFDVTGTITDNDTVGITVTPPNPAAIDEINITQSIYTIALDSDPKPAGVGTVHIALTPNSRCTVSPNSLDFTVGAAPQDVTVTAVNNLIVDTSPLDCVISHVVTSSDPAYTGFAIADVTIPVGDDDVPGISFDNGTSINVAEGGVTDTYGVRLDTQPSVAVTIDIAPDAQCTVFPTQVIIPALSTAAVTVTVTAVDDPDVEAVVHPCQIDHTVNATSGEYSNLTASVVANVTDNDAPPEPFYFSTPNDGQALTTINTTTGVDGTTSVLIENTGTADLMITSFAMTTGVEMTASSASGATFVLTPSDTATITVTCNSATANTFADTLTVNHDAVGSPATYPVTCNVAGVPAYTSTPAPTVALTTINTTTGVDGTTTLQIQNTGTGDLTISSFALTTGTVMTADSTLGATFVLAPTDIADITVTCNSATANTFTDTLTVNHDATGSPATYPVTCVVAGVPTYTSIPAPTVALTAINTTVGVNGTATLQIQNTGTGALTISSFAMTTGVEMTASSASGTTFVLASLATATITVTCNSATANTFTDTLTVNHDAAGSPATYPVTCNVAASAAPIYTSIPAPTVALTTINTTINVAGTATLQIQNTGTADLTISSFAMTTGAVMTASSASGATFVLAPLATATITVTCNSATANTFTDTLTVNHDAAGTPATYPVTCNVAASAAPIYTSIPAPTVALMTINTTVGLNGTTTLQVQNTGTADLTISSFAMTTGAVMAASSPLGANFVLTPGNSTTITVTCNSATANTFTDTLTVNHDAAGTPATYPVTCNVAVAPAPIYTSIPAPTVALTTINTTIGVNGTATLQIQNTGTAALTISSFAMTTGVEMTASSPLGPTFVLAAGGSTTITVTCNSATANTFTDTLTVNHDAAGTPATYPVTCNVATSAPIYTSIPAPTVALTTINTTINVAGTATLQIQNTGTATLTITSFAMTTGAPMTASSTSGATFTLAPAATATIIVTCNSATANTFTDTLTVNHNAAGNPATYPVTCNVTNTTGPLYTSSPNPGQTLAIAATVGNPADGFVRVTNTGTTNLVLTVNPLTGAGIAQMALTSPTSVTVLPSQSTDITIQCFAFLQGTFTATLTVNHNGVGTAPKPATYTVNCNVSIGAAGYGSVPAPQTTVDVGTVLIGTAISTNITVFETGTAQLNVTNIAIASGFTDFTLATTPFFSIPDGGTAQTITIRCVPTSAGLRTATLFVTTNDPLQPVVTYNLICTGSTVPVITATPPGFVASAVPPTATVIVPSTGQVHDVKGLAVRTGPYLGATLISVARPGTTYPIMAQNNEEGSYIWYLIKVGDVTGWVSGRYLQVAGTLSAVPFSGSIFDQIDGAPDVGVRLTTNAIIDMRRRPSPRVPRVGTIPNNTEVIVLGRTVQEKQTFWIQVSYNGVIGWIPALPVDMRGPREVLPVR